jgi:hypothetical protein
MRSWKNANRISGNIRGFLESGIRNQETGIRGSLRPSGEKGENHALTFNLVIARNVATRLQAAFPIAQRAQTSSDACHLNPGRGLCNDERSAPERNSHRQQKSHALNRQCLPYPTALSPCRLLRFASGFVVQFAVCGRLWFPCSE